MRYAIVLAAGKGTRMKSRKNKVMLDLLGEPVISHLIDCLDDIDLAETVVVTGYDHKSIEKYLGDRVSYAYQDDQIGTADAVAQVKQLADKKGQTLVVFGDNALIQKESIELLFENHNGYDLSLLTAVVDKPTHYARIIRDNQGNIDKVVDARELEAKDKISEEINLSVYCFNNQKLFKYLPKLLNDDNIEDFNIKYMIELMKQDGCKIQALKVDNHYEFMGINTREDLMLASKHLQERINYKHMNNGVTIYDPQTTYIGKNVIIGSDTIIYPNVHIYGESRIGNSSTILPGSWLQNVNIGSYTCIDASKIVDSNVGEYVTVGPNAHLRLNSEVGDHVRIGNYVEFKNTSFGSHSSCAHLVYLGDTNVGKHVNIGCGVVTVNYDGNRKHRTTIGDYAFIGSNVNLIAPIEVGSHALVAAGSTVSTDIGDYDLSIARARQVNKEKYQLEKEKGKVDDEK